VLVFGLLAGLYFLFKNRSEKTQRILIFSLMVVNLLQHLLKIYVYPQYHGQSFGAISTAYNMCALLIIITPFIYLFGSELWKNFIVYVGSFAGTISILVTYWLAEPIEGQIRFVFCHALLLYTSILPALFGIYKINYRKCYKLPFVFYTCLMILIVNDVITYTTGLAGELGNTTLLEFLYEQNPCWVMGPSDDYALVAKIIAVFTPKFLEDVILLWYSIPIFLLITLGSFGLGVWLDNERFTSDYEKFKEKLKSISLKINEKLKKDKK